MKTRKLVIDFKDPDGIGELCGVLGISEETQDTYFEYGEYGSLEIEVESSLKVVSARFIPYNR